MGYVVHYTVSLVSALLVVTARTLYSEGCQRSNANFNECVNKDLNTQRPNVKQGFPHIKIGPLDPLLVPKIILKQGNGPVSMDLTLTRQIFKGISNYNITSADVDLKKYRMEFAAALPWLHVEGQTTMQGRVLAVPIRGSGHSWTNYTGVGVTAVLSGHGGLRDDKDYFHLDTVAVDMTIRNATFHLNDLFDGNNQLGDAMNKLMADNWEVVYQELRPVVQQTAEALIKDIAAKVLDHYSLDDMFPL